jgi:3-oxoacid CoA-transferase B subunit
VTERSEVQVTRHAARRTGGGGMTGYPRLSRPQIAWRAAQDLDDGAYVNLGVGIPGAVAGYVPPGREVILHSENGLLGFTGRRSGGVADPDLVNASIQPVDLLPGGCFFDCADSFLMIRGGHLDMALLGAYEVSAGGDLASWHSGRPGVPPAVGGAMDIAAGAKQVRVLMEHTTRWGSPRLVSNCMLPLTAMAVVRRVYTDLAVLDVRPEGFLLRESLADVPVDAIRKLTGAEVLVSDTWQPLVVPDDPDRETALWR